MAFCKRSDLHAKSYHGLPCIPPLIILYLQRDQRSAQVPDVFLEKLLSKIGSEFDPESVPVHAEDYATLLNCFPNVDKKVRRDGGKPHYGWLIHKSKLLYEAERHAVWENEDGELVDGTPYEPGMNEIQFASDDN